MHDALGEALADRRVKAVLPYVRGRLLDLGCGSNHLVRQYANGIGVDVHPWPGADCIVSNSASLEYEAHSFDTVTIVAALNHIPNREAVLQRMPAPSPAGRTRGHHDADAGHIANLALVARTVGCRSARAGHAAGRGIRVHPHPNRRDLQPMRIYSVFPDAIHAGTQQGVRLRRLRGAGRRKSGLRKESLLSVYRRKIAGECLPRSAFRVSTISGNFFTSAS